MPFTPEQTQKQRAEALQKANDVRFARARLKREIKAGEVALQELLMEPPEIIHSMKLVDLLLATPKVGPVKTRAIFKRCRMTPTKTIEELSPRQRLEVFFLLR